MRKIQKVVSISVIMAAIMASSASATLLYNGDFESGPGGTFLNPGDKIDGWTALPGGNVYVTPSTFPYWDGNHTQNMDLTGTTGGGGIESDPFATIAGQTYVVTFIAINGSPVYPGGFYSGSAISLMASGGSTVVYSAIPTTTTLFSYYFTAADNNTTLTFRDASGHDYNAGWIDNVSVDLVPVPEYSTLAAGALMLLPFGVSTLRIMRKKVLA